MKHYLISLAAVLPFLAACCFCSGWNPSPSDIVLSFSAPAVLLLVSPYGYESRTPSVVAAVLSVIFLAALYTSVYILSGSRVACTVLSAGECLCLVAYSSFRMASRFRSVKPLFLNYSEWYLIQDYSRLFWTVVFCVLSSLTCLAIFSRSTVAICLMAVPFLLMDVALLVARAKDRTLLMRGSLEKTVRKIIHTSVHSYEPGSDDDRDKMGELYHRVCEMMEDRQLYLNENLTINELSATAFTNKVYLSRAINTMSGRNFRQFVNSYRVDYAKRQILEDPSRRFGAVALDSGFHSTAAFNFSFKLKEGLTPSEWYQTVGPASKLRERGR